MKRLIGLGLVAVGGYMLWKSQYVDTATTNIVNAVKDLLPGEDSIDYTNEPIDTTSYCPHT